MKRLGALALVALTAAGGCASSAKYVDKKKADSGIVAVPDDTDSWPNHNRRAALALIEKHVGPYYEILDERTVSTGRMANRNTLPETNEALNPRNQAFPAKRPTDSTTRQEETEYQITYRKSTWRPEPFAGDPNNARPSGSGPVPTQNLSGVNTVQTQYLTPGTAPGVQPAGGVGSTGFSVFNRGSAQPASSNCDH